MKSLKFARLAVIAAAAAMSSAAFAGAGSVAVSAGLAGACKFTSTPAMSFTLDPSVAAAANSNVVGIIYKCTKGTSAGAFTVGSGAQASATGTYLSGTTLATGALGGVTSTDLLQLGVSWTVPTAFTGDGFGAGSTGKTVNLQGTIQYIQFANAAPDNYTTSLAVTIAP